MRPFFVFSIMNFVLKTALIFLFSFLMFPNDSWAQGAGAARKVLDILSEKEAVHLEFQNLKLGAWEALSYLEDKGGDYAEEDLLEAVPDYYNFLDSTVVIKLVNPNDYNDYGIQLELKYLVKGKELILFDKKGKEKDRWIFLYLDENYLALDMGGLRVFFTKTPPQE